MRSSTTGAAPFVDHRSITADTTQAPRRYTVIDRWSVKLPPSMGGPAYTRLDVDERRRRLLELGARLFTEHAYDELSMAKIATHAGLSKALLYHYFPSKEAYFVATLEEKAAELQQRTIPDPDLPPLEQLSTSLDAYLRWIEENSSSYDKMIRSASAITEVRQLVDRVRAETAQ